MSEIAKAGDIIMIGVMVPEEYDGVHIDLIFEDFINYPHGWEKTLEGIKGKELL